MSKGFDCKGAGMAGNVGLQDGGRGMKGAGSHVGGRVVSMFVLVVFVSMGLASHAAWAQLGPPGPSGGSKKDVVKSDHVGEKSEKDSLIVTSEYYIGPEDVLEIIVWRNQDLSKVVTVRPDGRISLPLLGDIEATGLTPAELTANIVNRLKQFKETPTVSVVVQQVNSY